MSKSRKTRRGRKSVSISPMPFNGDHGTGTAAATAGTQLEGIVDVDGKNPNRMGRRRRRLQSDVWKDRLSMRQYQAARAIEDAYARVEALGSGGDSIGRMLDLRTTVDASPKPDATIDLQTGAQSHLHLVMRGVPRAIRPVIEHLFWHNRTMGSFAQGRAFYDRAAEVKVALDLVANHMRY